MLGVLMMILSLFRWMLKVVSNGGVYLEEPNTRYHKCQVWYHNIQTTYLLKRGEDKMTWGEKVGNNKRAIIK